MPMKRGISRERRGVIISSESKKIGIGSKNRVENVLFLARCSTKEALTRLGVSDVEYYKPAVKRSLNTDKGNSVFLTRLPTSEALGFLNNISISKITEIEAKDV